MTESVQVTALLHRWKDGDGNALDELVPVVYEELRRLARAQIRRDGQPTIQPTELVAEAYLRLVGSDGIDLKSRAHFFSIAARTMRRVLVDRYRRRNADRRGGGLALLTFDDGSDRAAGQSLELDLLDDALVELETLDPRQAEIVVLRFFGGLKGGEIAEVLGISERSVKREWAAARLWLFRSMSGN